MTTHLEVQSQAENLSARLKGLKAIAEDQDRTVSEPGWPAGLSELHPHRQERRSPDHR